MMHNITQHDVHLSTYPKHAYPYVLQAMAEMDAEWKQNQFYKIPPEFVLPSCEVYPLSFMKPVPHDIMSSHAHAHVAITKKM